MPATADLTVHPKRPEAARPLVIKPASPHIARHGLPNLPRRISSRPPQLAQQGLDLPYLARHARRNLATTNPTMPQRSPPAKPSPDGPHHASPKTAQPALPRRSQRQHAPACDPSVGRQSATHHNRTNQTLRLRDMPSPPHRTSTHETPAQRPKPTRTGPPDLTSTHLVKRYCTMPCLPNRISTGRDGPDQSSTYPACLTSADPAPT